MIENYQYTPVLTQKNGTVIITLFPESTELTLLIVPSLRAVSINVAYLSFFNKIKQKWTFNLNKKWIQAEAVNIQFEPLHIISIINTRRCAHAFTFILRSAFSMNNNL